MITLSDNAGTASREVLLPIMVKGISRFIHSEPNGNVVRDVR